MKQVSESLSHVQLRLYSPWNSPGQNTGVGSLSLLQGIFPSQGMNPGLPYCRQILYQCSEVKVSASNAGDPGSIPVLGRSPGEGKGYPLPYSGLENSIDCIAHGVTKS